MSELRLKKAGASDMKLAPTWWRRVDSNHRRRSQQIYSLSPLATWVLLRIQFWKGWSWWTDSNPRPADYKSAALPAELHQHTASVFTTELIIAVGGTFVNSFFQKITVGRRAPKGAEERRQNRAEMRRGSCGAACAGGSCTPGTPISSWTGGRCARTVWAVTPGVISPTGCGGWAGPKGSIHDTLRAIAGI